MQRYYVTIGSIPGHELAPHDLFYNWNLYLLTPFAFFAHSYPLYKCSYLKVAF